MSESQFALAINPADPEWKWLNEDPEKGLFQIRAKAYCDPQLFELEMKEIFGKTWLYCAHISELPNVGDFIRRKLAGRDLLVTRGKDGLIRSFHNACRHKGAAVCREPGGNASRFTCPYHAWTFANDGTLISVPVKEAYGAGFDRSEFGLVPVRMEEYRGMLFVCFRPESEDLVQFLGDAANVIDLFLDAHGGEWEVLPQPYRYKVKANWKLLFENSLDAYHAMTLHAGFFNDFLPSVHGISMTREEILGGQNRYSSLKALENGHAANEIQQFTPNMDIGKRDDLVARYGEDHADRLLDYVRNMVLFPNLFMSESFPFIRIYVPLSVGETETITWSFVPVSDNEDMRRGRISAFTSFQGPCGFATPDDVDVLAGCQENFEFLPDDFYVDASRGISRDGAADPQDEVISHAFLREWALRLEGKSQRPKGPLQGS